MAATDIILTGYWEAAFHTVDVMIAGLDCGSYVVASDGSVTVPIQSDPDKLLTGTYLQARDVGPWDRVTYGDATTEISLLVSGGGLATVYVPVVVGYSFLSVGRLLRPATEAQIKSPRGPALGKKRRIHNYAVLLVNTVGVSFGTRFTNLRSALFDQNNGKDLTRDQMYSGVWYDAIDDINSYDGLITWSVARPYPCTVAAITGFVETVDN